VRREVTGDIVSYAVGRLASGARQVTQEPVHGVNGAISTARRAAWQGVGHGHVPAANEMLGGLELEGLIERRPNPSDRRTHQLHVTESGRARLAEARVAVSRREAELEATFTPEQRAAIRDWLEGISEACR
jgi:hypothetical protein